MWAQCVQGLGVSRSSIRPRTRKGLPAEAAVAGSGSAAVALGRVQVPSEDPLPVPCLRSPHGAGSTPLGRTTALGLGGSSLRSGSPPPTGSTHLLPQGSEKGSPHPQLPLSQASQEQTPAAWLLAGSSSSPAWHKPQLSHAGTWPGPGLTWVEVPNRPQQAVQGRRSGVWGREQVRCTPSPRRHPRNSTRTTSHTPRQATHQDQGCAHTPNPKAMLGGPGGTEVTLHSTGHTL